VMVIRTEDGKTYQMTDLTAARSPAQPVPARALFVQYIVIFIGFLGYSLMITVFTPMLLDGHDAMLPAATPAAFPAPAALASISPLSLAPLAYGQRMLR
jgi:hypothetical protein